MSEWIPHHTGEGRKANHFLNNVFVGPSTEDREDCTKELNRHCTEIYDDPDETDEVQKEELADSRRDAGWSQESLKQQKEAGDCSERKMTKAGQTMHQEVLDGRGRIGRSSSFSCSQRCWPPNSGVQLDGSTTSNPWQ